MNIQVKKSPTVWTCTVTEREREREREREGERFKQWDNLRHNVRQSNPRTCAPSEYSDLPVQSHSWNRIVTVRILDSIGCKVSSCGQRRLWSDCADAQSDQSLRWAHMSEGTFYHAAGHIYSITSMARTRMARLPWMTRTLFSVPTKFFGDFFLFYHGIVCLCTH